MAHEDPNPQRVLAKHKPLERVPSAPTILKSNKPKISFPTKKLRMRSLLWIKPTGVAEQSRSSFVAQLFPTLIVNLAAVSVGLGYGFNSVIITQLKESQLIYGDGTTTHNDMDVEMNDAATSWIAGMFGLGAIAGGVSSAFLGSQVGRRWSLLLLSLPDAVGWTIIAGANNIYMVYVGRFMTGFAMAGYLPSILIYVAEISQPQHRGLLSAITVPAMSLGTLISYCLGYIIPWNFVAIIGIVIPIVLVPGLMMISNSPHWYLKQGQEKLAVQAMERFRSSNANGLSELLAIADVLKTSREYHDEPTQQDKTKPVGQKIKETLGLVAHRRNRRPFLIVNALFFLMLFAGDFPITFYAVEIFKKAAVVGGSSSLGGGGGDLSAVLVGCIRFVGALLFLPAVKYCTRRLLLTTSSILMGVTMAVLGTVIATHGVLPHWLPLVCVSLYVAAAPLGLSSLPYVFLGEFYSTEMRPLLSGITISLAQFEMFLIVETFPALSAALMDGAVFWMYAGVCFVAAVFTLLFVPETKGRSLEDIESQFGHKKNLHVTPFATPAAQRRNRAHPLQSIQFTL